MSILFLPGSRLLSLDSLFGVLFIFIVLNAYFYSRRKPRAFSIALLGLGGCVGVAISHTQALHLFEQAQAVSVRNITAEFRIQKVQHSGDYQTAIVRNTANRQLNYVTWNNPLPVKAGEIWRLEMRQRPLSSRLNQGGSDRQAWYFSQGITATGTVKSAVKIRDDFSWRETRFHQAFERTAALSQQGLLLALGFGERAWLSPEIRKVYQRTNTAHLIAISGLHIGLAMMLGTVLGRVLQFFLPTIRISPLFPLFTGVSLAWIYVNLAGFAVSTSRALLALLLVTGLRMTRGYCSAWQLFIYGVALLLLSNPLMVLSVGFWLSAGAVFCLILWYRIFPLRAVRWRNRPIPVKVRWIFALLHLQFGLLWLFTPVQVALFNGFSWAGLAANLIAVPFFSFLLVPLVLFAVLTDGAGATWQIADQLAQWIARLIMRFDGYWLTVSEKTGWILTALLTLCLLMFIRRLYRELAQPAPSLPSHTPSLGGFSLFSENKPAELSGIVIGCLLLLSLCGGRLAYLWLQEPDWRVETLDVGQGLATLIVKNQRAVLYDTGVAWEGGSMAEIEILPYLQRQGIVPEQLILSHDDKDHAGGARVILRTYPDIELITPSHKNYGKTDRTFCVKGLNWHWQGLTFEALSPAEIVPRAENGDSCIIRVSDGIHRVLLTGDADVAAENRIIDRLGKINVLQVGHHGSKTSTGSRLVRQIRPDIALISSGRWNPWHFPHPSVTERLIRVQSAVKNTAVSGQISVRFHGGKMALETVRTDFSPWYRGFIGESTK
ncbi:DNA internalization-related competence protein ComEC/Rec2 [Actinobacillus succinogenes]|nr:DNA internalization-related competence protein ComEC/Rec2 [Actinobacillus succinogenes]